MTRKSELAWQSLAGPFAPRDLGDGHYETEMTVPVLAHAAIPFVPEAPGLEGVPTTINEGDSTFDVTPVSMGNPHAVLFVDDIFNAPVEETGARLTRHETFPEGANIGFCQVVDRQFVRLRVYERGVGETQACGSGACAAVVAARLGDKVDERVKVSLPGGKLRITWSGPEQPVTMIGTCELVFSGELQT